MSPEADYIVDRRRLKRRLLIWRLVTLAIVAGVLLAYFSDIEKLAEEDHIARLNVDGIIVDDVYREQALDDLLNDDNVHALIVRIDSPGGTVVGGENLYHQLKALGKEKPVVAVMGSLATSAGYMTALAADRLFAREGTVTGSIGVLMQTADVTGLLEKIGVKPETIKSGPMKAQPNPMETLTPEAREVTREVVMDMYDMFVGMVAERRNMPLEEVLRLADGRIYTGRQALKNGLIDAIGSEAEAIDWLREESKIPEGLPVEDLIIERPTEGWRQFFNGLVGKTLLSERLRLDGLVSLWHPEGW